MDGGGPAQVGARVVHDDHGAIRQITDRLVEFLPFPHERQLQFIAGGQLRPKRFGEFVQIERGHILQARDLAEV